MNDLEKLKERIKAEIEMEFDCQEEEVESIHKTIDEVFKEFEEKQ